MRLRWLAFLSACSFSPQTPLATDGAPADSWDARTDGGLPPSDAGDAPPPPGCPADYAHIGQLASKYKLYGWSRDKKGLSFSQASALCAGTKTHLAVIDSAAEAIALGAAIAVNPKSPYFWDGVTDVATENSWLTVVGAAPLYLPWGQNEPDGGALADCTLAANGKIYDWFCATPYPFACECENP